MRRRRPSTAVAVLLGAVVAVAAACGSSDTASRPPATAAGAAETEPSTETAPPVPLSEAELRDVLDGLITSTGSSGGIVALVVDGADPTVVAAGVPDTRSPTPVAVDDPLLVASITKSFVAAAALSLEADGVLSLDDPVSTWVDWPGGEDISLRSLLQQTSGVAPFGGPADDDLTYSRLLLDAAHDYTIEEVLDATRALPPAGPPGTPAYSNLAYVLAGAALERATGQPLGEVLDERVFAPAGLTDTWYAPDADERGDGSADGRAPLTGIYEVDPSLPLLHTADSPPNARTTLIGPAAGAVSTVGDLLTWADVVLGERRLGDLDLSAMSDIDPGGYGLGVVGVTSDGACVFEGCPAGAEFERLSLNGDLPGSSTRVMRDPETGTTLVVYLNRNGLSLDEPMIELLDRIT